MPQGLGREASWRRIRGQVVEQANESFLGRREPQAPQEDVIHLVALRAPRLGRRVQPKSHVALPAFEGSASALRSKMNPASVESLGAKVDAFRDLIDLEDGEIPTCLGENRA